MPRDPIVVCLSVPAHYGPTYLERARAVDPRIEAITLPIDPGSEPTGVPAGEPHPEPPPWGMKVAEERREVLARMEVLVALHAPIGIMGMAPRLRWLQGIGAGMEQFARAGVARDRVTVTNASGVSAGSMSEFIIGRLLSIWKRFREMEAAQARGEYVRAYGRTFLGSTVGIVGMGHIGVALAERLRPLGVRVLGLKRTAKPGDRSQLADALYAPAQLHEMLGLCDAVVVAAPSTPETFHLIDADAIAAMRPDAVLVNVARGELVDEAALVTAMRGGHLQAAVLDVFETEPLPGDSPLWTLPNVYISAHASVSVDRYMDDVFDLFIANLERYARGEPLHNGVDTEALGFPALDSAP